MTWEQVENLPTAVIEEFERGTVAVVTDHFTPSGPGQEMHTLEAVPCRSDIAVATSKSCVVIKENER